MLCALFSLVKRMDLIRQMAFMFPHFLSLETSGKERSLSKQSTIVTGQWSLVAFPNLSLGLWFPKENWETSGLSSPTSSHCICNHIHFWPQLITNLFMLHSVKKELWSFASSPVFGCLVSLVIINSFPTHRTAQSHRRKQLSSTTNL